MGRIMLLSCENREHLVELWRAALEAHWPGCSLEVDVLDKSTKFCWTRRLQHYLEHITDSWVLLWVDDNALGRPAQVALVESGLEHFLANPDIATLHVSGWSRVAAAKPIAGRAPFVYFPDTRGGLCLAAVPHPAFWRRKALLRTAREIVVRCSPEQDDGWAGFYNWELNSGPILHAEGWRGVGLPRPAEDEPWPPEPISHINAFKQGMGWTAAAKRLAGQISYELDLRHGFYPDDQPTPCSDAWRGAGRLLEWESLE